MAEAEVAASALRRGRDNLDACARTARVLTADMDWQARAARELHAAITALSIDLARLAAMADEAAVRVVAEQRENNRWFLSVFGR